MIERTFTSMKVEKGNTPGNTDSAGGTVGGGSFAQRGSAAGLFQMLLKLSFAIVDVGSEFEVRFSLYSKAINDFISEEWVIPHEENGSSAIANAQCIIKDIEGREFSSDVYLVCRVIRRGHFNLEQKAKGKPEAGASLRRPFGVGIAKIEVNQMLGHNTEAHIALFQTPTEATFSQLPELIIAKDAQIQNVVKSKGIVVEIQLYPESYADLAANASTKNIQTVELLKMPEMIMPGDVRNDLFVTLDEGDAVRRNVEVSCQLRKNTDAAPLPFICGGSGDTCRGGGCDTVAHSVVLTCQPTRWRETFALRFPPDQKHLMKDCHLYFEVHKISSKGKKPKVLGFTFLKLTEEEDHGVVKDGKHRLSLYKPHSHGKGNEGPLAYLDDKADKKELKASFISVKTQLASTDYSQNTNLLRLFRWRNFKDIQDIMKKLTFVDTAEIVRHLELIFRALFEIQETNDIPDVQINVYKTILFTIGKLTESHSAINLRPVLDYYLDHCYKGSGQHGPLLQCLSMSLQTSTQAPDRIKEITSSMRVLDYIFLLIIQSRLNYVSQNKISMQEETFKKKLLSFLHESFNNIMGARDSRMLIAAQTYGLKHFPTILFGLGKFLSCAEMCETARVFLATIEPLYGLPKLNLAKLSTMQSLITAGEFMLDRDTRLQLVPLLSKILWRHLECVTVDLDRNADQSAVAFPADDDKENKMDKLGEGVRCVELLGLLVDLVQLHAQTDERTQYLADLLSFLPVLLSYTKRTSKNRRQLSAVATVLLCILRVMTPEDFEGYLARSFQTDAERMTFWCSLCCWFSDLMKATTGKCGLPYSMSWGGLTALFYTTLLKFAYVSEGSCFVKKRLALFNSEAYEAADTEIWREFYHMCLQCIRVRSMQADHTALPVLERYGDLRAPVSGILRRTWGAVSRRHTMFPSLVSAIIELMNMDQRSVKANALDMYFTIVHSEITMTGGLEAVKASTLETFDRQQSGTDARLAPFRSDFADFYFTGLSAKFQAMGGSIMQKGIEFISDLKTYLELLCKYETVVRTTKHSDEKVDIIHSIMDYLRSKGRIDTFAKYVHLLSEQYASVNCFTEAANSLLLLAEVYSWNESDLQSAVTHEHVCSYPAESSATRKERVLAGCIALLDRGKDWEGAVPLLQQLVDYAERSLNYRKVATYLRQLSTCCESLAANPSLPPDFYRVGFFGRQFPPEIRNKEFIYKAKTFERLQEMRQRILEEFPGAEELKKTDYPGPEITEADAKYVLVTPVNIASPEAASGAETAAAPKEYRNISTFSYSKVFRKQKQQEGENEFVGLYLLHLYMTTHDAFPGTRLRSEVVRRTEVECSPLESAIKMVSEKNQEIMALMQTVEEKSDAPLSPFTMCLNGVIAAGVNGGIPKYQEAFLTEAYQREHPQDEAKWKLLRQHIVKQMDILYNAMALHLQRIPPDMKELHQFLQTKLDETKKKWDMEEEEIAKRMAQHQGSALVQQ
eukprot:TRINITY_DN5369_c0_g1_i1.p1 TRINITY_DN5369_c0_g1~~TRINITY_DN5369_c0_g1_i1.p1  ORF type:complete len:1692 (-),score=541.24 TRINITY_DN5369_c0_g1_i1:92-4510(-)